MLCFYVIIDKKLNKKWQNEKCNETESERLFMKRIVRKIGAVMLAMTLFVTSVVSIPGAMGNAAGTDVVSKDSYIAKAENVLNAIMTGSFSGVIPAVLDNEGNLIESEESCYTITVKAPVNEPVSLGSTEIKIVNAEGENLSAALMGNLFFSAQADSGNGIYSEKTAVDYFKISQTGEEGCVVNAYDAEDNLLTDGMFFLATEKKMVRNLQRLA